MGLISTARGKPVSAASEGQRQVKVSRAQTGRANSSGTLGGRDEVGVLWGGGSRKRVRIQSSCVSMKCLGCWQNREVLTAMAPLAFRP